MLKSKAFSYSIETNGDFDGEHQSSPHWVLTFIRWAERDTLRTIPHEATPGTKATKTKKGVAAKPRIDFKTVRQHLVVENDCVQVSTNVAKGTLTPGFQATLLFTDINYMTAVAPGDFCFVNMLNWGDKAKEVTINAHNLKPINGEEDGFKGVFKVQSVREMLVVDPATGAKNVAYKISGYAFTEFNNTIYFNPALVATEDTSSVAKFAADLGAVWTSIFGAKGLTGTQDIISALIRMLIGSGAGQAARSDKDGNLKSPNTMYYIPQQVGKLLGLESATAAKDMYNYLFGIQTYGGSEDADLATGMNPNNLVPVAKDKENKAKKKTNRGHFLFTTQPTRGVAVQKADYWNQVKLWSILQQFVNAPLNEMFTTFRIAPSGSVMPTVVLRQIPFTNDSFDHGGFHVTKFMNLPRWVIDPALVLAKDIGRDEAARINFVQVYGRPMYGPDGLQVSAETAAVNFLYDVDDVKRSGLRPLVVSGAFDDLTEGRTTFQAPQWARIIGDALIGGHLKINGTLSCIGIEEPIAVGDNLEFDGTVFHIEQISHSCAIDASGRKQFRTNLSLSSGISVASDEKGIRYAEMDYGNAYAYRENDGDGILPGVSESQDSVGRKGIIDDVTSNDKAFEQPNTGTAVGHAYRFSPSDKKKKAKGKKKTGK